MKEENIMKKVGYFLIGLGFLDFLISLGGVDITSIGESPVVFVVIGGALIYFSKEKKKQAEFDLSLAEDEAILKKGMVSIKTGLTKTENGSLYLTDRKLVYSGTSKSDMDGIGGEADSSNDFELSLKDISNVKTKFPNFIVITDKDNNEFKLIPFGKKKWRNEIQKAVSEHS
tara:strand:+ start:310 stop:825 length:516 start_codon:yes stop_codon:yes gene_type:complete